MGFLNRLFGRSPKLTPAQALACITNRPMMITNGALDMLLASAAQTPERGASAMDDEYKFLTGGKPEDLIDVDGGVGVLSIRGPLFQRFGVESWWYGGSSYDVIGQAFDLLLGNPKVQRIVLDMDSPGGTVSGCFELAEHIYQSRGAKPIDAVANDMACSAMYAIASACDRIHLSQTGAAGSVGVIATHVDISGWNASMGVAYTSVTSGERKADYSPNAPLGERARSELQAEVNRLADIFINTVARNRGLDPEAVRGLQAGVLFGPAAVAAGLADAIGTVAGVVAIPEAAPAAQSAGPMEEQPEQPGQSASADQAGRVDAGMAARLERKLAAALGGLKAAADAEQSAAIARAAVVDRIQSAGIAPDLAMALIAPTAAVTPETVDARIDHARAVLDLCTAAGAGSGLRSLAPEFITRNTSIEAVRAQLIEARAEDGPELVTSIPAKSGTSALQAAAIYAERRKATEQPK